MTRTGIIARAALMGTALVLGSSVLGPSAWADSLVFDLNQSNLGAGFTGPFIEVTVDRTSTTLPLSRLTRSLMVASPI
jgi:hypothetical protein